MKAERKRFLLAGVAAIVACSSLHVPVGGTTMVFDFALQDFNETMTQTFERRNALAALDAAVDYSFHIGVKDIHGELLDSIKDACDIGVTSYKVFMVYDFGVKDGVFYQLLTKSKEFGALIAAHAENNELVNTLTEKYISEGNTDAWYHYMSRPEFVEGEADERAINLAKAANAPLYIVHLANKQGVEAVTRAKDEGYEIYAETCPQYLEFTSDVYKRADGRNFICSPPMKGKESQDAIWEAIRRGDIDTIATDHCPFQQSEKDWGFHDFRKIPNGCAGIENMYPYMLGKANDGIISFEKAVELCSTNPAKIFGCTEMGEITPGKDADIVIYDPAKEFTIHNRHGNHHRFQRRYHSPGGLPRRSAQDLRRLRHHDDLRRGYGWLRAHRQDVRVREFRREA